MEEIADRLRKIIEADERKRNGQKISQYEREDLEKKFILKYAKENNLWINDFYSLGNSTGLRGNENTILVDIEIMLFIKVTTYSTPDFLFQTY